jgi:hypothetical protein
MQRNFQHLIDIAAMFSFSMSEKQKPRLGWTGLLPGLEVVSIWGIDATMLLR